MEWWYNSSFIIFIGLIFAKNEEKIIDYAKKHYAVLLILSLLGTVGMYFASVFVTSNPAIGAYNPLPIGRVCAFLCYVVQTISEMAFVALILLITMKIQFNNAVLNFLGKIALEIYLIHRLYIGIFRSEGLNIQSNITYCALVYLCTIVSAVILHNINSAIVKTIKK